tara:strand:- start:109 stop:312 length:204 start_codon:yes stop_codon:yes gene_type:complete
MSKEYKVSEIKGLKADAEAKILAILKQLEADTVLSVLKVDLTLGRTIGSRYESVVGVNIDCEIKWDE